MTALALISFCLSFLAFPFCYASEQALLKDSNSSPFDYDFAKLVNETLELWHVPGLSIGVVDGDNIWTEGFGIAEFPSTPVTASTLFYAGSTTKAFTAACMSLLVDDNDNYPEVQWNTPVSHLIRDDFVLEDEWATAHITIEDALSHRTGMPRHDVSYGGYYDGHRATAKDVTRALRYLPMTAEPRTRFQYCNMMFVAMSHLIETLVGRFLGDELRDRIWKPLSMHSTYFTLPDAQDAPEFLARGYTFDEGKYIPVRYLELHGISGAGSVISNVIDYTKWISAWLNYSPPLSKQGYTSLKTSRSFISSSLEPSPWIKQLTYALGWDTGVYQGYEFFRHDGGTDAYGAMVIFFPSLKYGLVAFANTAGTSNSAEEQLLFHLIDDRLGISKEKRFDWNKKNWDSYEDQKKEYENAPALYYPDTPNPPLPLTGSISDYAGTYYHPAYRDIKLYLKDGALHADRENSAFQIALDFTHVSGDYFITYIDLIHGKGGIFKQATPAEFKLGEAGKPIALGIAFEPEMEGDLIWFDKI
ncbi:putative penicillin-binding protein [Xylogone sp. PMI_703]|nr:putative penicillin-binding protein [Xylogone sp. PMI_703]